jgi:hypothetical protein
MKLFYRTFLYSMSLLWMHEMAANLVSSQDLYLVHRNFQTLALKNNGDGSVFLTSSLGNGYQYELKASQSVVTTVGMIDNSAIACSKPFGIPTSCATSCKKTRAPAMGTTECTGAVTADYSTESGTDFLNEQGTHNTQLNYVFLDTLINEGATTFEVAVTEAPLYRIKQNEKGQLVMDSERSIAGALDAGSLSIFNNIHGEKAINLGSHSYPVTFLTDTITNPDGRFTFGTGTRQHMASSLLALDATTNHGPQTIILIPTNFNSSCQPIIFIGRDNENSFYALTYLSNHTTQKTGIVCCADANNNPCVRDTLYSSVAVNDDPRSLIDGQRGRLKIVLGSDKALGGDYVTVTGFEILPGLWWPGQKDFATFAFKPSISVKTSSRAPMMR